MVKYTGFVTSWWQWWDTLNSASQCLSHSILKEGGGQERAGRNAEANIIQPSNSPWASPIVLVDKKDGTDRFCVDYRKLNNVSKFDAYPMPRVEEIFESIGPAKFLH